MAQLKNLLRHGGALKLTFVERLCMSGKRTHLGIGASHRHVQSKALKTRLPPALYNCRSFGQYLNVGDRLAFSDKSATVARKNIHTPCTFPHVVTL
uniref:Uncharacterized protein n=1 Tax=Fundulus heteroclitus TaxID=8078 RepID=A0A146S6B2_FUNHE